MRPAAITTPLRTGWSVVRRRAARRDAAADPAQTSVPVVGDAAVTGSVDPAPLTAAQLRALGVAVTREVGWGLRRVSRRVDHWRTRAAAIPDPTIRNAALQALDGKRGYADGSALFWTLPSARNPQLIDLLTDFQVTANFLDVASEHAAAERGRCGTSLMDAFVDAVDVDGPIRDHAADHPWSNDGGYLRAMVEACRAGCAALPGYRAARPLLLGEAARARALELGHDPNVERRDAALKRLAAAEYSADHELHWFELTAGGAAAMTVIALLALAGDEQTTDADRRATVTAYRWVSTLSTMLDSYVDQAEDRASGSWCAINAYDNDQAAVKRIAVLTDRTLREVSALRHGERHTVIVSAMIALFLSRDSARSGELAGSTRALTLAGGSLTRRLVPVLRAWRVVNGLRAA